MTLILLLGAGLGLVAGGGSQVLGAEAAGHPSPVPAAVVPSPPGPFPADAVKAVFLYRFAGYVQWPAGDSSAAPRHAFTIAVLDADNVAAQLARLLPDHPIHGEAAHVERIRSLRQLGDAQMLYIGPSFAGNLMALLRRLAGRPVLVVTDEPGALSEGSMLNFVITAQHVRFEVSTAAARRSGLKISSDLLAVASRVQTGEREDAVCRPLGPPAEDCYVRLASKVAAL